jgi:hypothetical protein
MPLGKAIPLERKKSTRKHNTHMIGASSTSACQDAEDIEMQAVLEAIE